MNNKAQRIAQLKALITQWNHEYYVLGQSSVSDLEYDRVFDQLKELDPSSITVGSDLGLQEQPSPFAEHLHSSPMLSLDKVYTLEELEKWMEKTPCPLYSIEPKIDGVSVSLQYRSGILSLALTRGDGIKGLDITANVKTIKGLPHTIKCTQDLTVRGEIYISKEGFEQVKNTQATPYANPRNLAAGVLRRINPQEVASMPLQIFVYQAQKAPIDFTTHQEALELMKQEGFPLPPYLTFIQGLEQARPIIKEITQSRKSLPFEIDGLVFKINDIPTRLLLGSTNHHPKWAMAFKFDSPSNITTLENITLQVGRTGKITPLAHLAPTLINGTTVRKATLHNKEYIQALEIGIGDLVEVSKRGEIIPAIEKVVEKRGAPWVFPFICPCCHTRLINQGVHLFCPSLSCPERVQGSLLYFAKKIDLEGFGESFINTLYNELGINTPQDLWFIDWELLQQKEGFGEKKINNLRQVLQKAPKQISFLTLLIALGISEASEHALNILFKAGYNNLETLKQIKQEEIMALKGLGEKTAQSLLYTFSPSSPFLITLRALEQIGFCMEQKAPTINQENLPLVNTHWVLTGIFEVYKPRSQAQALIQKLGGEVENSITQKTTHLLFGHTAGSKLSKAKQNPNIKLLSEIEFQTTIAPLINKDSSSLF